MLPCMKKINDIFYSLQGEGRNTGRAAVFIRFAECNLRCPFCDTEFDSYREMSDADILDEVSEAWKTVATDGPAGRLLVVLTGGEPTLQVDEAFVDLLHGRGYEVAMESNGTRPAPANIDWLTVSPKGARLAVSRCNELKVLFSSEESVKDFGVEADCYYLQPCDTGDVRQNRVVTSCCVDYVRRHPQWRLSLQTHKLVGFK